MSDAVYIGVDQALGRTGVSVLPRVGDTPITLALIETKSRRGVERLAYIRNELTKTLVAHRPVYGAMEGFSIGSTNRPFDLGEAACAVKLAFHDAGVPFVTVAPKALKKYVTSRGDADKDAMAVAVRTRFKQVIEQDDMCDAYGLSRVARDIATGAAGSTRPEAEVLRLLRADEALVISSTATKASFSI